MTRAATPRGLRVALVCDAGIRYVYPQVPDLAELLARDGHLVEVLAPVDAEAAAWNAGRGFAYVGLLRRRAPGWLYNLAFIAKALWHCRRAERVIACSTVTLVVALLCRWLPGKRVAFYALECQIPGEPEAGSYAWVQHLLRWHAPLVAATGAHRARLLQRFLHLAERPAVVENSALLQDAAPSRPHDVRSEVAVRLGRDPGCLVVLNGGLGRINALELVLDAVGLLGNDITLALIGPVEASIARMIDAAASRHGNVVYLGTIAGGRPALIRYLASADLGLVLKRHGHGRCLNDRYYTPNKAYDFIAATVPVVCSRQASMAHLVDDGIAVVLPQLTEVALAECLRGLAQLSPERRAAWRAHIDARYRARYHFERDAAVFRAFAGARRDADSPRETT